MTKKINENIPEILKNHKTIAVVGLSDRAFRPSRGVAKMMQAEGYRVIPINPNFKTILGERCYPSLGDAPEQIDLVNVFRRPVFVDEIVEQAIETGAKALWLQLGVVNPPAAQKALNAGLDVVMDRCWSIEYQRYMLNVF